MIVDPPGGAGNLGNVMDLQMEQLKDYDEIIRLICHYKLGKIDREFFKSRLFELGFNRLTDEELDIIVEETQFVRDGAVSIFGILIFLKRLIEAGTTDKLTRVVGKDGTGLIRAIDPNKAL